MALLKRRKKRMAEDKWVLGEKLTKAGRERARRRKMLKKVGGKIKTVEGMKEGGKSGAKKTVAAKKKAMGVKSKVKAKDLADKGSKLTKAGVYPKYKKESKSAGSFRSAFKSNCAGKGAGSTFTWQGRSYSCAKKSDKPTEKKRPSKNFVGPMPVKK
tara:strand:- start:896 stop:1366 length:471 start_codon:yes stop_codon:yes gene_type:complete